MYRDFTMNVAVIVLDTLRKDRISPYNDSVDFTPNLEAFSKDSETYTQAYSQAPWSFPSQTSFLTGLYPWQHGATQKQLFIDSETDLLQEKLSGKGYRTGYISNNTYMVPITGVLDGFDETDTALDSSKYFKTIWKASQKSSFLRQLRKQIVLNVSNFNTSRMMKDKTDLSGQINKTGEFLDNAGEDDYFLYLNLVGSHYPYRPPEDFLEKHDVSEDVLDLDSRPLEYSGDFLEEEASNIQSLYDAEVEYLDYCFGQVIESFKDRGLYEDTLILVFADHGELLGEEGKFGHHFSTNRNLVNIPMIMKYPGNEKAGERNEETTEVREMHYRILEQLGLESEDVVTKPENTAFGMYGEPHIYGDRHEGFEGPEVYAVNSENSISRHVKSAEEMEDLSLGELL